MKVHFLIGVSIFLTIFSSEVTATILPKFIKACKRHDPEISQCIINSVESLRPKFKTGIPQLKLRSMEPFMISELTIKPAGSGITIKVKNVKVYGGSGFKFNSLKVLPNITEVNFDLAFPELELKGRYNAKGKYADLNVLGDGEFTGTLNDFGAYFVIKFKFDGKHVAIDKAYLKVKIGKGKVKMNNLKIDGESGKKIHDLINNNFEGIVTELLPTLESTFSKRFSETFEIIVKRFSFDVLFPES